MLKIYFFYKVSENDFLPKELCSICAERLKDFRNFKELCLGSHRTLIGAIENGTEPEVKVTRIEISSNDSDSTVTTHHNKSYHKEIKNHHNEVLLPQSTKEAQEINDCHSINNNDEKFDKNFFYCSHCTKRYRRKLLLWKHLKNTHFNEEILENKECVSKGQRQLKCPHDSCSKRFFCRQETLNAHLRSHSSEFSI